MPAQNRVDLTGRTFGEWTVLRQEGHDRHGRAKWRCRCKCSNVRFVTQQNLRRGTSKSCGCLRRNLASERNTIIMVLQKYGRLTVIKRSGSNNHGYATWLCECECGNKTVMNGASLRNGNTRSCGCLRRENGSLAKGESAFNIVFSDIRRMAKKRGYEWQLTKEQVRVLTGRVCFYCGVEPKQGASKKICNGVYLYNGLDRADNKRGYTIDNVVPCCKTCNLAKRTMSVEEFRIWVCNIYEHFGNEITNVVYA